MFISSLSAAEPKYEHYQNTFKKHTVAKTIEGKRIFEINIDALADDNDFQAAKKEIADFNAELLKNKFEKIAFYVNAYNIYLLDVQAHKKTAQNIDHDGNTLATNLYPDEEFIVAQKTFTFSALDEELRQLGDMRYLFAVFCTQNACPAFQPAVFRAATLTAQMFQITSSFLTDKTRGTSYDADTNTILASKIFHWFHQDFGGDEAIRRMIFHFGKHLPKNIDKKNVKIDYVLPLHTMIH